MGKVNAETCRAYLFCVLAMAGWGSNYVAAKIVYRAISGLTLLFLRYLIALTILLVVYRNTPRPKLTRTDWKNLILIGAFGYCTANALQMIGAKLASASMSAIINAITPVSIVLFAIPLLREKASPRQMLGILLTVAGSVVIVGSAGEGSSSLGILLNFAGMALWGLASVWIRRSQGNLDGIWTTIYGTAVALITDLPLMAAEVTLTGMDREQLMTPTFWAALLWSGAVATAGANLWWNRALEALPAATCSVFYALMPVITAVLELLILHERFTLQFFLGSAVIMAGVVVAMLGEGGNALPPRE